MKAYKVELLIIDHSNMSKDDIKNTIENTKYPNWCIYPEVKKIESRNIGEWHNNHPLNLKTDSDVVYKKLFKYKKGIKTGLKKD